MQLQERTTDGVSILDLHGRMVLGDGDERLLEYKVRNLVQQGCRKLVLNLGGVTSVDTTGLRQLILAYITLCRHKGKVKLLNVANRPRELLSIAKLLTVFEVFDSEQEAVGSFSVSSECCRSFGLADGTLPLKSV